MTGVEFQGWPKTPRLFRDIVVTEKIDGTNAAVGILEDGTVYAQSRTRLITPELDNHGFARWVAEHADDLIADLGTGLHFGEWWGNGINRGYGLPNGDKRFSLFNTKRFEGETFQTGGLGVVPVLHRGELRTYAVSRVLDDLENAGSVAAPGFMRPEGVCVFHTASRQVYKATLENDAFPKGATA